MTCLRKTKWVAKHSPECPGGGQLATDDFIPIIQHAIVCIPFALPVYSFYYQQLNNLVIVLKGCQD
jgi:hypothetical protein